jgi:hypothetical protein
LQEDSVVKEYMTTAADGKNYRTQALQPRHHHRVKSVRGTQFRIWATQRLREYIVKGFVMDDERRKKGRIILMSSSENPADEKP